MATVSALFLLFGLACAFILGGLSVALAFTCETETGLAFAVGGFLFSVTPLLIRYSWDSGHRWRQMAYTLTLAGGTGIFVWLAVHAPDGHTAAGARIQSRYSDGEWRFDRHALGNLLPESDQLLLGFKVVPAVDSLLTMKQGRRLAEMTSGIYRELEADPDFHALGSVMPEAYHDLVGMDFNEDHYFLYIPPKLDRNQMHPALVFLHGSGGNFKAYTWILSRLADELGMVLIAPSYGMGNWNKRHSSKLVSAALLEASVLVKIDPHHIHLMGLSNGGLGVSQVGANIGERFRTLTFISPVFDKAAVTSSSFLKTWKEGRVLVISGKRDDRVPFSYVRENVAGMTEAGLHVDLVPVEDADHFMIFSHRKMVLKTIASWLREKDAP
jgi:pimeloyl-ACP methyl ester carboxylesterase